MLSLRFQDDRLEAEFRAHYIRTFRNFARASWYLAIVLWVIGWLSDRVLFPELAVEVAWIRGITFVFIIGAAVASTFPSLFGRYFYVVLGAAAVAAGIAAVSLLGIVGYPRGVNFFITIVCILVTTSNFVAVLRAEYTVVSCGIVFLAFVLGAFWLAPVGFNLAVRMTLTAAGFTVMGLVSTYVVERYARENFLQRRAIAEKVAELEASERRALEANRAKSTFLSNMSHELRTPLNAVLGFAQLMERDRELSPESRSSVEIIQRSGEHLLDLINDVLAISKIEAGKLALSEQPFDPVELFETVGEMVRVRTRAKGLVLAVEIDPAVPSAVVGDESKLRQVLINLLGNAVKFTDEGGVALRVHWAHGLLTFEVEDTGHGIAEAEVEQIFEAFTQSESGRKSKEGTGLGLAISRNFVRLMGGQIRVRSALGQGTVFTVEVPMRATESAALEREPARVRSLAPGQPTWRILAVDDTTENRALLDRLLGGVGFDVRLAVNGLEAVEIWREWRPHLVVMDMRMPVMDGREATRTIRELEAGEGAGTRTVILALTASAFEHERGDILESGCDAFVAKPFREATIFDVLSKHLGARFVYDAPDAAAPHVAGDDTQIAEGIAALSPELVDPFRRALLEGDLSEAERAIERIDEVNRALADRLRAEVRAYEVDKLIDMLEK